MRDIEYGQKEQALVNMLNEKTDSSLVIEDFMEWMEPEGDTIGNLHKFDNAVKEFLGEDLYHKFECCARLPQGLDWQLGLGKSVVGGVNLKRISEEK